MNEYITIKDAAQILQDEGIINRRTESSRRGYVHSQIARNLIKTEIILRKRVVIRKSLDKFVTYKKLEKELIEM